jgi:hypothetical protein
VVATGGLAFANLAVFFLVLARMLDRFDDRATVVGSGLAGDMWFPLIVLGLAQTGATGLALTLWRATRPIGLGLIAAAAAGAAVIAALGFFLVLAVGS